MKKYFVLTIAALMVTACGSDKDKTEQSAQQEESPVVRMPFAEDSEVPEPSPDALAPAENIPDEDLPDLSKLSTVERQIFRRTVSIQVPYYDALEKWADAANDIKKGSDAAKSLRKYIALQNDFAIEMQQIDAEFAGKIDANYQGSQEFQRVLDAYLNDPDLMRRTDYIMRSYMSLIQRFKDDPACKDVFADIERMAREAQQQMQ
ncbi:hypothetical protein KQI65_04090 [bacterium]|nr:hypothetical protein [bacterium]